MTAGWLPIGIRAPEEVLWIARQAEHPQLGQHLGRVFTMSDGRWLVLNHQPTGKNWSSYIILEGPPI
jgi:hypothetical protein